MNASGRRTSQTPREPVKQVLVVAFLVLLVGCSSPPGGEQGEVTARLVADEEVPVGETVVRYEDVENEHVRQTVRGAVARRETEGTGYDVVVVPAKEVDVALSEDNQMYVSYRNYTVRVRYLYYT